MKTLMQLWRPEFKLVGINSDRETVHCSCVRSSMLHGKENEVALQWAEMRMVRWMCDVKVKHRVPSKELRKRQGLDDITLVAQQKGCNGMGMCCKKKTMIV